MRPVGSRCLGIMGSKQEQACRIRVDGTELVLVEPEAYEQRCASRRQVGARSAQPRALTLRPEKTNALLDAIARAVADADPARGGALRRTVEGCSPTGPGRVAPRTRVSRDRGRGCYGRSARPHN